MSKEKLIYQDEDSAWAFDRIDKMNDGLINLRSSIGRVSETRLLALFHLLKNGTDLIQNLIQIDFGTWDYSQESCNIIEHNVRTNSKIVGVNITTIGTMPKDFKATIEEITATNLGISLGGTENSSDSSDEDYSKSKDSLENELSDNGATNESFPYRGLPDLQSSSMLPHPLNSFDQDLSWAHSVVYEKINMDKGLIDLSGHWLNNQRIEALCSILKCTTHVKKLLLSVDFGITSQGAEHIKELLSDNSLIVDIRYPANTSPISDVPDPNIFTTQPSKLLPHYCSMCQDETIAAGEHQNPEE